MVRLYIIEIPTVSRRTVRTDLYALYPDGTLTNETTEWLVGHNFTPDRLREWAEFYLGGRILEAVEVE